MEDGDKQEILEAIQMLSTHMDRRFAAVDQRFFDIEARVATKDDLRSLEVRLRDIIDEKLGDLKGDIVLITRKEDKKLVTLVEALLRKGLLDIEDAKRIFAMEPFPQPMLS